MNVPLGRLALIGLRCSGKSSLGRAVAALAAVPFVDLDQIILARARASELPDAASVGEVLQQLGEPRFRELEALCLEGETSRSAPRVLATGGGVVEHPANGIVLRAAAHVLWLQADLEVLQQRIAADATFRPSLTGADPKTELAHLAQRRNALYAALADEFLDTSRTSLPNLARSALKIWTRLAEKRPNTRVPLLEPPEAPD